MVRWLDGDHTSGGREGGGGMYELQSKLLGSRLIYPL